MKITLKNPAATDLLQGQDTNLKSSASRYQRFGDALGTALDKSSQSRAVPSRTEQSRVNQAPTQQELAANAANKASAEKRLRDRSDSPSPRLNPSKEDPSRLSDRSPDAADHNADESVSDSKRHDHQPEPTRETQEDITSPADLALLQLSNAASPVSTPDPFLDLLTAAKSDRSAGTDNLASLASSAQARATALQTAASATAASATVASTTTTSAIPLTADSLAQLAKTQNPSNIEVAITDPTDSDPSTSLQLAAARAAQQHAAAANSPTAQSQQAQATAASPSKTATTAHAATDPAPNPPTPNSPTNADAPSTLTSSAENLDSQSRQYGDSGGGAKDDSQTDSQGDSPSGSSPQSGLPRAHNDLRPGFDPARAWATVAADILGTLSNSATDAPSTAPAVAAALNSAAPAPSQPPLDLAGELALAKQADTREAQFASANHGRILTAVRGQLLPNGGQIAMRLDPPELGVLQIRLDIKDGVINASFQSDNARAADLLTQGMTRLKQSLESAGISVDRLTVQMSPPSERSSNDRSAGDQSSRDGSRDSSASRNSSDGSFAGTPDDPSRRQSQRDRAFDAAWRAINGDPVDLIA